ncbi:MAG TPA: hypothetical protein VFB38_01210 [Chthonomonadaceae bacterium]|nr:hypothetical protein [Chthonomonadaceae bacterium]
MFSGRFGQAMEALSIALILLGIVALCQSFSFPLYQNGFKILIAGWLGLTLWSHRRPVRPKIEQGNPQVTIDGHPPIEVTLGDRPKSA